MRSLIRVRGRFQICNPTLITNSLGAYSDYIDSSVPSNLNVPLALFGILCKLLDITRLDCCDPLSLY